MCLLCILPALLIQGCGSGDEKRQEPEGLTRIRRIPIPEKEKRRLPDIPVSCCGANCWHLRTGLTREIIMAITGSCFQNIQIRRTRI